MYSSSELNYLVRPIVRQSVFTLSAVSAYPSSEHFLIFPQELNTKIIIKLRFLHYCYCNSNIADNATMNLFFI